MSETAVHDGRPCPTSPIVADRPELIPWEAMQPSAHGGHPGRDRVVGSEVETRTVRRLRRALRKAVTNPMPAKRIPADLVALLTRMRRADRALRADLGRAPTFKEVATALGLADSQKAAVIRALRSLPSHPSARSHPVKDEPILLMEITDRPEARGGRAE